MSTNLPPWITMTNQGATRNLPLSPELIDAMSFLGDMGIRMEVFSGGQHDSATARQQGTGRVGSTRHDHGHAADAFFYDMQSGRRLNWADPNDLPIFREIVARARANGVTGIGAGPGYMPEGSMHVGFGNEAVWGDEGLGQNAPAWLREAFYNQEPGSTPATVQYAAATGGTRGVGGQAGSQPPGRSPLMMEYDMWSSNQGGYVQEDPNYNHFANFMGGVTNNIRNINQPGVAGGNMFRMFG